ncbi:hypothetical protein B0H11DRAFT_1827949 [Mycena galericulata]|nr:hypothetical protein B0H11DRAFT_1827949 [Mycena galericulata]
MSMPMHSPMHARQIALKVAKFKEGIFEDEIRSHRCSSCKTILKNPVPCSGCKVVRYCSDLCQKRDWKASHQHLCKVYQTLPDRGPQMRAIAQQFPWARIQTDGTFSFQILQASRNLLGSGAEFGWWTERPCCAPDAGYLPGFLLLERQHLRERAGWKLLDPETPWLDFSFGGKPPKTGSFEQNWASYYNWRGLPIKSPAALLLHWPMTVYRLLTIAGVVPQPASETRRQLTVHMLGVEKEVDFLPIFGELALLLPNTDISLIMFGHGVADLLAKAQGNSLCLAAQPVVFGYTAPKVSGGGSIRISLARERFWKDATLARQGLQRPDAMVACNAGLRSYPEWTPVVLSATAFAIPFAVTDYNEIILLDNITSLLQVLPIYDMGDMKLTPEERLRVKAASMNRYEVRLNPFMRPGPRPPRPGGISAVNGYEMVVVPAA